MIRKIDSNIFSLTILKLTTFSRIRQYRLLFQIIIVFLHRNKLSYSSDMEQIIGRKTEIRQLTEYYHSGKAEFVAVPHRG